MYRDKRPRLHSISTILFLGFFADNNALRKKKYTCCVPSILPCAGYQTPPPRSVYASAISFLIYPHASRISGPDPKAE